LLQGICEIKGRVLTFEGEPKVVRQTMIASSTAPAAALASAAEREAFAAAKTSIPTLRYDITVDRGVPFEMARDMLQVHRTCLYNCSLTGHTTVLYRVWERPV
jgi:hypothetical protein